MIDRELTFYPETERTRDLIYSEHMSCDRSIHVLLQDCGLPNYRFLLEGYREIVSRYGSVSKLQSPAVFLAELAVRLEEISRRLSFGIDDLRSMGFYVLLRSTDACYLMASRDDDVYMRGGEELLKLSEAPDGDVERLHSIEGGLQEELFPQRLRDGFVLYRISAGWFDGKDILLGCGESEKNLVMETLSDPMCQRSGRATVSSKFIARKVLVLRFERDGAVAQQSRHWRVPGWRRLSPRVAVASLSLSIVVFAAVWLAGRSPRVPVGVPDATIGEAQPVVVDGNDPVVETPREPVRLVEKWRRSQKQPVTSSPAGYRDYVIYGSRDGGLYAVDRGTGEVAWSKTGGAGIGASPMIDGTQVVSADYEGRVSALHVETGAERWTSRVPARVVSSPVIMDGRVLIGCFDGIAYCLDMNDGRTLWIRRTGARIRGSGAADVDHFYVPSYDGHVYALAAATGAVRWRVRLGGKIAGAVAVYGNRVVVGTPDGQIYALAAADGAVLWRYRTGGAVKSAPRVASGRVYIGSNDRNLYCLNLADGTLHWKYETGDVVLARPAVSQGRVFVGSYDGYLYCLDAGSGTLIDRYRSDGAIYSSPLAEGGAVYFGTNKGSFMCVASGTENAL